MSNWSCDWLCPFPRPNGFVFSFVLSPKFLTTFLCSSLDLWPYSAFIHEVQYSLWAVFSDETTRNRADWSRDAATTSLASGIKKLDPWHAFGNKAGPKNLNVCHCTGEVTGVFFSSAYTYMFKSSKYARLIRRRTPHRTSASDPSPYLTILPQVHLRKLCYNY